jgi:hypothetical protein
MFAVRQLEAYPLRCTTSVRNVGAGRPFENVMQFGLQRPAVQLGA